MTVRFIRTGRLNNGADLPATIGWAKELNGFIEKNLDVNIEFGIQQFANGEVVWMTEEADLATFDQKMQALMQNQDYWVLVNKGRDFFVPGSLQDRIIQLID